MTLSFRERPDTPDTINDPPQTKPNRRPRRQRLLPQHQGRRLETQGGPELNDAALWMQAKNAKILFGETGDTTLQRSNNNRWIRRCTTTLPPCNSEATTQRRASMNCAQILQRDDQLYGALLCQKVPQRIFICSISSMISTYGVWFCIVSSMTLC